jgi:hypothetical protein
MNNNNMFEISLQRKDKPLKISPTLYGAIVNCVGLRGTISYAGEPKNNKVDIGVEGASSGWTRASLQTALENYPPLSEIEIAVKDK